MNTLYVCAWVVAFAHNNQLYCSGVTVIVVVVVAPKNKSTPFPAVGLWHLFLLCNWPLAPLSCPFIHIPTHQKTLPRTAACRSINAFYKTLKPSRNHKWISSKSSSISQPWSAKEGRTIFANAKRTHNTARWSSWQTRRPRAPCASTWPPRPSTRRPSSPSKPSRPPSTAPASTASSRASKHHGPSPSVASPTWRAPPHFAPPRSGTRSRTPSELTPKTTPQRERGGGGSGLGLAGLTYAD